MENKIIITLTLISLLQMNIIVFNYKYFSSNIIIFIIYVIISQN